ncbi:unnamed protein product [Schistosoma turkestanicum]|nr:unnamed protein product [Schistosoma turkestanicum]
MYLNNKFLQFFIIIHLVNFIHGQNQLHTSRPRRVLPADSYTILGQAGFRRLGQCNITYAWLTSPPTSSLDAYGHASACTRLQLLDGQIIPTSSYDQNVITGNEQNDVNQAEQALNHVNKEWSASLIDLERLDLLIRAEVIGLSQTKQLANDARYFFLADRVGDLNLMAVLRPDKQLKLELINPLATEHLVLTPQHVLCLRKQCPTATNDASSMNQLKQQENTSLLNGISSTSLALTKAERHNRELYMQLIISRVACALIGFMCVVFAMTSLTLCIRLRQHPLYSSRKHRDKTSQGSICKETHTIPTTFCQMNGKLNINPISYMTDQSPRHHYGIAQIPSETTSLNNILMTTSNLPTYDPHMTLQNMPITYSSLSGGTQYSQLSNYPMTSGAITSAYTDTSGGLITIYPLPSHGSIHSTQHGLLVQCQQNGQISPAPSNDSDGKNDLLRNWGSLGRHTRHSMCYGDSNNNNNNNHNNNSIKSNNSTHKKLLYPIRKLSHQNSSPMIKQPMELSTPLSNNRPIPLAQQQQQQQHQLLPSVNKLQHNNSFGKPEDLISFQYVQPQPQQQQQRYPLPPAPSTDMKTNIPAIDDTEELNADMLKVTSFNHVNEPPSLTVIRKPAHVN